MGRISDNGKANIAYKKSINRINKKYNRVRYYYRCKWTHDKTGEKMDYIYDCYVEDIENMKDWAKRTKERCPDFEAKGIRTGTYDSGISSNHLDFKNGEAI